MTPLGNYVSLTGLTEIDPIVFMLVNWPLVCEITGLQPEPDLDFIGPEEDPGSDVHRMGIEFKEINNGIQIRLAILPHLMRYTAYIQSGSSHLSTLWSTPAGIVRHMLLVSKIIPPGGLIDEQAALMGGLPENVVNAIAQETEKEVGSRDSHLFEYHFDERIIEAAVEVFMTRKSFNSQFHPRELRDIIHVEKCEVMPSMFY